MQRKICCSCYEERVWNVCKYETILILFFKLNAADVSLFSQNFRFYGNGPCTILDSNKIFRDQSCDSYYVFLCQKQCRVKGNFNFFDTLQTIGLIDLKVLGKINTQDAAIF